MDVSALPHLNASLNGTSLVLLSAGYAFVRAKRVALHRICMLSAFAAAVAFLVSYVVYHSQAGSTRFTGTGLVRSFYFFVLVTHISLAAAILPLAIVTIGRALRGDFARHRAIARWTWPLWMYVSATGLIVYAMLYHLYPPGP